MLRDRARRLAEAVDAFVEAQEADLRDAIALLQGGTL